MVSKKELINNLREYSSDQVVEAINAGIITMYELSKSGNMTPLMRKHVEEKLAAKPEPTNALPTPGTSQTITQSGIDAEIAAPERKTVSETSINPEPSCNFENVPEPEDLMPYSENDADAEPGFSNKGMFRRPFSFKGRIRRTEFGITFIIYFVWYVVGRTITEGDSSLAVLTIYMLTYIPMLWFLLAQGCKRCHDRGNSGWYQIIPFYPICMLFGKGDIGENKYGDSPKN